MKLSKRGEYGIRAMLYIAAAEKHDPSSLVQIKDIAAGENVPAKFLEQILLMLKNAGLLHSKMGVGGGYYLGKPAHEITIGHIVRTLDGPLAPIRCVSQMAYEPCDCPNADLCGLRMIMFDVRNAIAAVLDGTTLADLITRIENVRSLLLAKP